MLIVCPNCSTSYEVKTEAIGDAGRTVRCSRCRTEWFATAPLIEAVDVATPAASSPPPSAAPAVDRPASPADPSDHQIDWDIPVPVQPAPGAADGNFAEEDTAVLWDVPQALSPPLAPESGSIEAGPPPSRAKIETTATRGSQRTRRRHFGGTELPLAPTLIAVQVAVICVGLLWRNGIVRLMPQTASFFRAIGLGVNTRGLVFADMRTAWDAHDGVTVLVVEGVIVNTTGATIFVPRLRFALRSAAFVELLSWTALPDKGTLGPGETQPFRSRLVSPSAGGADILVRFLSRLDLANGAR
jgi:predicted Zn finger-like uncharacterized protein